MEKKEEFRRRRRQRRKTRGKISRKSLEEREEEEKVDPKEKKEEAEEVNKAKEEEEEKAETLVINCPHEAEIIPWYFKQIVPKNVDSAGNRTRNSRCTSLVRYLLGREIFLVNLESFIVASALTTTPPRQVTTTPRR
ncbi:hypothetical protein M8J77_007149 [Diaphorina citri]|nr:hypothetical protein M8J77_007149 [Diaphorina citri]